MHFDLTDEQKQLRDSIEAVLRDYLPDTRLMSLYNGDCKLDVELWRRLAEQGIPALLLAEDRGGAGMDMLALTVVAQACGYFGAPVPVVTSALTSWLINHSGSKEQKERWLDSLVSGQVIPAFAFNEGNSRWLPEDWTLSGATLSGAKTHVERADEAGLFLVGMAGGRIGMVERSDATTIEAIDSLDRTRPLFEVRFHKARVDMLDADSEAIACLRDALLVLIAADAAGAGTRALELAVSYARIRKQFGRLIGSFQGLKYQLADMTIDMAPCFALAWHAAHAWDQIPAEREASAARAKAHICDVAVKVSRRAVEAHGGIGYTWEYPLHVWLKRAMADRVTMGLPALHRERIWAPAPQGISEKS